MIPQIPNLMFFRSLAGCTLALLLCSCTGTSVKKTWRSPEFHRAPFTKIAVLAVDDRQNLRRSFENCFVAELAKGGTIATTTVDVLSLPDINQDKKAAAERLRAAGAEVVVMARLAASASSFREVRPGAERYSEVITGMETTGWYDYYSVAYMDMSPTYGTVKQHVFIETSVFDLTTAKRLWSGVTQTVLTETMDPVDEISPFVVKVVAAMRKDGIVP
jgi:hypothetical protein